MNFPSYGKRRPAMSNPSRMLMVAVLAFAGSLTANGAGEVPRSFVASPDVYKVVAKNDQYLVIEVTWKPGQRDNFHSHAAALTYRLTDCTTRNYTPDGRSEVRERKAGQAGSQQPIVSHSVENIGKNDCKLIMFEPVGYVPSPEWEYD
jgi:hypothetical protein